MQGSSLQSRAAQHRCSHRRVKTSQHNVPYSVDTAANLQLVKQLGGATLLGYRSGVLLCQIVRQHLQVCSCSEMLQAPVRLTSCTQQWLKQDPDLKATINLAASLQKWRTQSWGSQAMLVAGAVAIASQAAVQHQQVSLLTAVWLCLILLVCGTRCFLVFQAAVSAAHRWLPEAALPTIACHAQQCCHSRQCVTLLNGIWQPFSQLCVIMLACLHARH